MNELQWAMIGFSVLLVAVVWGYNIWQERKQRRMTESAFPDAQHDVLMAGQAEPGNAEHTTARLLIAERNEPAFEPVFADALAVSREPTFDAAEADLPTDASAPSKNEPAPGVELGGGASRPLTAVPVEWADGRADCLLRIEFVDPVSVSALWTEYSAWSQKLDKPVQWLGLDERTSRWRNLLPQDPGAVAQVAAALQLVDRRGAVSEAGLTAFLQGVHRFAQSFSGLVELPETAPVLAAAGALDSFCAAVDVQLSLHVLPRQGSLNILAGSRLRPLLDAAGLRLEGERFMATDAEGAELFTLSAQGVTAFAPADIAAQSLLDIALSLDVPRVADGAAAYDRMLELARRIADGLGGHLADPQKKPLTETTSAAIRAHIQELQARMAAHGIPAGGMRALRLFS